MRHWGVLLAVGLMLVACQRGPAPSVRYTLGAAYQEAGIWRYPREDFSLDTTGIATVYGRHDRLTADGEAFDDAALAAGHPTLQLPALALVTNLENGRAVRVRINDRGPGTPTRLIAITPRTATLLAAADPHAVRVRVQVLEAESRAMAGALRPEGPVLQLAAAPAGAIQSETLAPPPGAGVSARGKTAASAPRPVSVAAVAPVADVPLRLPEAITQGPARPGVLDIELGGFSRLDSAEVMRARLGFLGARTQTRYDAPRDRAYRVFIGPFASVPAAEAVLARALAAGAPDARIVVD